MAGFDVFKWNAFSMFELSSAVNANPYRPGYLGSLNLFTPKPIDTTAAAIEIKNGILNLIQTSPRGGAIAEGQLEKRDLYHVETSRIAKGQTIQAAAIQNVRAFGSTSELQSVMNLLADRLNGPTGLIAQVEYTWENMRLGAIQGIVADADGTVLVNWFDKFGVAQSAEINFDLANAQPASGAVRKLCSGVVRGVQRALGGLWLAQQSYILALCGDNFWDDLTAHPEIRQTYLNTQQAAELRGGIAFESFQYGGITWVNYRGSDDGTTLAIGSDKVKFVPVNVPGLFDVAFAPSESLPFVNTPGLPMYSMLLIDDDRQQWVRPEVYSYPLFICTRPAALFRGKRTA
jgi:hypothetical protein